MDDEDDAPFDQERHDRFVRLLEANAQLGADVDEEVAHFDRDSLEALVVERILIDLKGRRGLRHEWDGIDLEIRREIEATWRLIVRQVLRDSQPL